MTNSNLSFDDVNDALLRINSMTETSEAHGTLCGMICICGKTDIEAWFALIFEGQDQNNIQLQQCEKLLANLCEITFEKLNSDNYDLEILIHHDDDPLDVRIEDLSLWCQGFLYGLSLAGLTNIRNLPIETREILQDMTDISKAGFEPETNEDENETAFAEIIEYIRIGSYVVFNTFNTEDLSNKPTTVH